MRVNFRTILIIFLVALLGGAVGTYGVLEINKYQSKANEVETTDKEVIQEVSYVKENEGAYVQAIKNSIDTVVEITTKAEVTSYNFFYGQTTSNVTYLGSGVLISDNGYIVTNEHVVSGATEVSIKLQNGDSYDATVIGTDVKTDLALLKIDAANLPYAKLVDSDGLELGEEVIAIGNGLGKGTTTSNGIISALNREVKIDKYQMTLILTNADINQGNSGGGLFDLNGNLVGIVNAKTSSSAYSTTTVEGIGYAIPANTVKTVVKEIMENGFVKDRPTIGVSIYSSDYSNYYNIDGLVVSAITEGGAAEKAGMQVGDIIKAIDGKELNDFSDLSKALDSYKVGDKVTLDVERKGESIKVNITLQEASN